MNVYLAKHYFGSHFFMPNLKVSRIPRFSIELATKFKVKISKRFCTIINTFDWSYWEIKLVLYVIIQITFAQWEVLHQSCLFAVILQMKKSCHVRQREDNFRVTYLSYSLILHRETSMLGDSRKTETKRKRFFYQDSCGLRLWYFSHMLPIWSLKCNLESNFDCK